VEVGSPLACSETRVKNDKSMIDYSKHDGSPTYEKVKTKKTDEVKAQKPWNS